MQDTPKAVWSIPYVSVAFFQSLKQNFIAYRSSKVSSRPDWIFEIHQLWQSSFSRMYSISCCNSSFEPEIIKIGQSSHKMYNIIKNLKFYIELKCTFRPVCTRCRGIRQLRKEVPLDCVQLRDLDYEEYIFIVITGTTL